MNLANLIKKMNKYFVGFIFAICSVIPFIGILFD